MVFYWSKIKKVPDKISEKISTIESNFESRHAIENVINVFVFNTS